MNGMAALEKQFLAKLSDMADLAKKTGKSRFTNFLDPYLLSLGLGQLKSESGIRYQCFGGYENAERNIVCVYRDKEYGDVQFPISPIKVVGRDINKLSHRDYLGTLMSIGIKREMIGDIVIGKEETVFFAIDSMSDFIINNIDKVGGVGVSLSIAELTGSFICEPEFLIKEGTVASTRIDAVLALGFGVSRTAAAEYVTAGRVFLNHRLCQQAGKEVKEGDLITVRGLGRIVFENVLGTTKKDRIFIRTKRYV